MRRREVLLVLVVAALWGCPYLLIKVAVGELPPLAIVWGRVAVAALLLVPLARRRGVLGELRGRGRDVVLLGAVQLAGPFVLLTLGERWVSSSLAAILAATAPLFIALLGRQRPGLGLLAGFAGVVVLLGREVGGSSSLLAGSLLVLGTSLGYAVGALLLKRRFAGVSPLALTAGTTSAAAALLLVPALATAPSSLPSASAAAAVLALGALPTAAAFVLFAALVGEVGPGRASVVAYLAPGLAVVFGGVFLGEAVGPATLAGLGLVLGGSFLAGRLHSPRWPRPGSTTSPSSSASRA